MILVDTNLLVYASVTSVPAHERAKRWLDERLNGEAPVGIPWTSLLGFLRLTTNARIFAPPIAPEQAWRTVEYWLDCDPVWIPQPTEKHRRVLEGIFQEVAPQGNLPDAHLAALSIEHGLTLCSTDSDFARFAKLNWENPLRSGPGK